MDTRDIHDGGRAIPFVIFGNHFAFKNDRVSCRELLCLFNVFNRKDVEAAG